MVLNMAAERKPEIAQCIQTPCSLATIGIYGPAFVALEELSLSLLPSLLLSQLQEVFFLQILFMLCMLLPRGVNTGFPLCPCG